MEAFKRTTDRGGERVCLRFPRPPPAGTLVILKSHGARYRQVGKGAPAAWFVPMEQASPLMGALGDQPAAAALRVLLSADGAPPQVASTVLAEGCEQDPGRIRKRARRSGRFDAGPCQACQWQVRMLNTTGRYHEPQTPHDSGCGF
jgi:hypothetical protein